MSTDEPGDAGMDGVQQQFRGGQSGLIERAKQHAADCEECAADQLRNHMVEMPVRYWNAMAREWREVAAILEDTRHAE